MSLNLADPLTKPLLQSITLRNFLSFGPRTPTLYLQSLNVLIGPNGSGKSNLLEALSLLRSCPTDLRPAISKGGGVGEWIWKGTSHGTALIDVVVSSRELRRHPELPPLRPDQTEEGSPLLRHYLAFGGEQRFGLYAERIEYGDQIESEVGLQPPPVYFDHRPEEWQPVHRPSETKSRLSLRDPDLSILAQLRDPHQYPGITYLAWMYDRIRLYREWTFGGNAVVRKPQRADLINSPIEEDFSNLGLSLSRLRRHPKAKAALLNSLRDLYPGLTDFDLRVEGGTVQVFIIEGDFTIPATRLSDGSLRYLCLLAIMHDPDPPPLIGIEEPELGLHPDLLPKLADLLIETSKRTQLVVTTHSDILVDALTEHPDSVVVCEKCDGCTSMRRLNASELKPWLEKYRLGQLWTQGQLGGTRW